MNPRNQADINYAGTLKISIIPYSSTHVQSTVDCQLQKKGKGRLWVLQHCCLEAYCTLTRMSYFIHLQMRCTHQAA